MPILPPLRTTEGVQVPDLSGLRLRFAKHADEKLTLSMGEPSTDESNGSWRHRREKGRERHHFRREFLDVYDGGYCAVSMGSAHALPHQ